MTLEDTAETFSSKKLWLTVAAGFIGICAATVAISDFLYRAEDSKRTKATAKLFAAYDENKNGLLDLGEITARDAHLHRVLNIDGKAGISLDEFESHARMEWSFADSRVFETVVKQGPKGEPFVTWTRSRSVAEARQRDHYYLNRKPMAKINGELVELKDKLDLFMALSSLDINLEDIRTVPNSRELATSPMTEFSNRIVNFDLRNPDDIQLSVFEYDPGDVRASGVQAKVKRDVIWIKGRETPEIVRGSGQEIALLTAIARAADAE